MRKIDLEIYFKVMKKCKNRAQGIPRNGVTEFLHEINLKLIILSVKTMSYPRSLKIPFKFCIEDVFSLLQCILLYTIKLNTSKYE